MTDGRWLRVKALFQAAVERPAAERDAFLAAATGDDEALRREVESLLPRTRTSAYRSVPTVSEAVLANSWFRTAAMEQSQSKEHHAGGHVGPYEIVATCCGCHGDLPRSR